MPHNALRPLVLEGGFVSPALSQRAIVLAVIVAFHVLLVYALASGLARSALNVIAPPIELIPVPEVPDDVVPPEPPPPNLERMRPLEMPMPEGPTDPPDNGDRLYARPAEPVPVAPAQPPVVVEEPVRLVGRHQLPNTEDYYPAPERRAEVEGAANVRVCVDERGKRQGEPTVTQSSGNARFDEAALDVVRDGRYARATRGTAFVPNCYGFRVVFKMSK
jgi:periplasmic protein TonB